MKCFQVIESLRALFNFWVCCCHQESLSKYFLAVGNDTELLNQFTAKPWSKIASLFGYQVDVFFVISGFLLTWGLLQQNRNKDLLHQIIMFVVKRFLRLWPIYFVLAIILTITGEYSWYNFDVIRSFFLLEPMTRETPQVLMHSWSNRVDLLGGIAVIVVVTILKNYESVNRLSGVVVVVLSLIPRLLNYLNNPELLSYMRLGGHAQEAVIITEVSKQLYYRDKIYKDLNNYIAVIEVSDRMNTIFFDEYFVTIYRWTPLFIGMLLAIALKREYDIEKLTANEKNNTSNSYPIVERTSYFLAIGSHLCLAIGLFSAVQPMLLSIGVPSEEELKQLQNPSLALDIYITVFGRAQFAAGWSYLLYRCLRLTVTSTISSEKRVIESTKCFSVDSVVSQVLGMKWLQTLGTYSYCIYMLHYKVMHDVNYTILRPVVLDSIFTSDKLFQRYFLCLSVSYVITLAISVPIVKYIEQPLLKLSKAYISDGIDHLLTKMFVKNSESVALE